MRLLRLAGLVLLFLPAAAAGACTTHSGGSDAGGCPNDLPATCPSPPPSYKGQVASIIEGRCILCHNPQTLTSHDYTTYMTVYDDRGSMLDQVYHCMMPPLDGGTKLPESEREALLGWLVCNAPDN
jgi:hypothetical protein